MLLTGHFITIYDAFTGNEEEQMTIEQELSTLRLLDTECRLASPAARYRNEWMSMKDATHHEARLRRARGRAGISFAQHPCGGGHSHAGYQP